MKRILSFAVFALLLSCSQSPVNSTYNDSISIHKHDSLLSENKKNVSRAHALTRDTDSLTSVLVNKINAKIGDLQSQVYNLNIEKETIVRSRPKLMATAPIFVRDTVYVPVKESQKYKVATESFHSETHFLANIKGKAILISKDTAAIIKAAPYYHSKYKYTAKDTMEIMSDSIYKN